MHAELVFVGTYTRPPQRGKGIVVFKQDRATGELTEIQANGDIANPSFLALDTHRHVLYAVNEVGAGQISSFRFEEDGRLERLSTQPTLGGSPCHLCVDPSGRFVFAANYGNGVVSMHPVKENGALELASDTFRSAPEGGNGHWVGFDPSGRFLLAVDKGVDKVFSLRPDLANGKLSRHSEADLPKGCGPRHLDFHPNGRIAFVNGELDMTLTSFAWDPDRGSLTKIASASTLPEGVKGDNFSTAEVIAHPLNGMVYVSNRGHNSIAALKASVEGTLELKAVVPCGGKNPRHMSLDPGAKRLYVAHQDTDDIVQFDLDNEGLPKPSDRTFKTGSPVCVLFS